jgi:hypothetical protein
MSKLIARELPLVKRRIALLLAKIEANGCTPGEAAAATVKVEELIAKYKLDPAAFRRPRRRPVRRHRGRGRRRPRRQPRRAVGAA